MKLVVGPAGEKIKFIQRKSKCRIQHAKEEQELEVGFGMGPLYNLPIKTNDPNAPVSGDRWSRRSMSALLVGYRVSD